MLIELIAEAKRHDIWEKVKVLLELVAIDAGLVVASLIFAAAGWPKWYSIAIALLIAAICVSAIFIWLANYTYIAWQQSISEYQQSDEPPYSPTYYQQDNVA